VAERSRRWDGDERGAGVADGRAFRPGVEVLTAAMGEPDWVAEDPEAHVLPHIRRACERSGRLRVVEASTVDAVFEVTLEWVDGERAKAALREDVFAVVGSFAESSTHVRQRELPEGLAFEVTTGMLAEDAPFRPHGHLVRLVFVGDAVRRFDG